MKYDHNNLLIKANADSNLVNSVTASQAGWNLISFEVHNLKKGDSWSFDSTENELAIIMLSGVVNIESNRGEWRDVGERENVFAGGAHALYLPRRTQFSLFATCDCQFAVTWVPTDCDHEPWHINPADTKIDIRGGDNATRQINNLLPPGSPVHRLVLVEVYTPSGNWSSYPPHKHDEHVTDEKGNLLQAELEEIYFYKIDKPDGYAYQRIYTDDTSPLQKAGNPIDAIIKAEDDSIVLVPGGYHPVVSAPGYTTYYLNVLAGSAQSLACYDDPRYEWVKDSYKTPDPRVPLY